MKNPLIICRNMLGQHKKANFTNKFNFIDETKYNVIHSDDKNNLHSNLHNLWKLTLEYKNPIVLGGDHSLAISTLSSSICKYGQDIKVLWFDAHADINSYTESNSKNIHGMVLNYLCNINIPKYNFDCNSAPLFKFIPSKKLNPSNIMYIGIRDLDEYEKDVLKYYNIQRITCDNVNNNPEMCIDKINTFIGNSKTHLSIDIDALDPLFVPCTGTPVDDGIQLDKLQYILKNMNTKNVIHTDVVEYNPSLGNMQEQIRTQETIKSLLQTIYCF